MRVGIARLRVLVAGLCVRIVCLRVGIARLRVLVAGLRVRVAGVRRLRIGLRVGIVLLPVRIAMLTVRVVLLPPGDIVVKCLPLAGFGVGSCELRVEMETLM